MISRRKGFASRFPGREHGFTLVELVMVIAIIAVLIAVAIPIYQNVTRSAAQKAHDTNLRMIDSAVQQYNFVWDEFPVDDEGKGDINLLKSEGFLEEIPQIPALLKGENKYLSGEPLDQYYLDSEDPPRAGPVGRWEGYRSAGPYDPEAEPEP